MDGTIQLRNGLYRIRRVVKQSNLLLVSNQPKALDSALSSVVYNRFFLESYLDHYPSYRFSLAPVRVEESAPRVVRLAASAAEVAGVGPMAAVPGALAELAVEAMCRQGSRVSLVENGGEIAAVSVAPINVGVYAGNSPLSGRIGFHLTAEDFPIGIATSSASVSHAINFGEADAAIVVADTASMADAAAKAVCNAVRGIDIEASVQSGLEAAEAIPNIRSALVIRGGFAGTVGRLPRLLKLNGGIDELFRASLHEILPEDVITL